MLSVALLAALFPSACGGSEAEPEPPAAGAATTEQSATAETTTEPETTTKKETTTEAASPPTTTAEGKPKPPPGVPAFVAGYRDWRKLNAEPLPPRDSDPHLGVKNVYASKPPGANGRFPNGTIVVKEATRPGADFVGLIATMRKERGADPEHNDWVFVEWTRESAGARFALQAEGAVCWSCHADAVDSDYVFTAGG